MVGKEISSVLVTTDYEERHLKALKEMFAPAEVLSISQYDDAAIAEALSVVDVAVLATDLDHRFLEAPQLKWVHCDHAGLNGSATPELFERKDLVVTGSAGRNAPALAQHVLFFALALGYESPRLLEAQRSRTWGSLADYEDPWSLWGKTMGIIGMGNTGKEVAKLAKACGMRVLGYGRNPERQPTAEVDTYFAAAKGQTIEQVLIESDYLVLTIRLTDTTNHMISTGELSLMKPSAYLINVARGAIVDEVALAHALTSGEIRGAGLDVFEKEPLPADASIWDAPNTILTSHTTLRMPNMTARSLDILQENIRRYKAGLPLRNTLRPDDVYSA